MAVNWLVKATAEVGAPKHSVIQVLKRNIGGVFPKRPYSKIHASDVTKPGFCPRHVALLDLLQQTRGTEYIDATLKATFDAGNAMAKVFVENWAGDSAIGNWKCLRCHKTKYHSRKPKEPCCSDGHSHIWEYKEVEVLCQTHAISGSFDVLMDLGAPKYFITELKIIKPEDFAKLVAPMWEHELRTQLYMRLAAGSDHPFVSSLNLTHAKVVYISRGYGKKNPDCGTVLPFREFDVFRDDSRLDVPLKKADAVQLFRTKGVVPLGICSSEADTYAKDCTTCKACMSSSYPVGAVMKSKCVY